MALIYHVAWISLIPHSKNIVVELLNITLVTTPALATIDAVATTIVLIILASNDWPNFVDDWPLVTLTMTKHETCFLEACPRYISAVVALRIWRVWTISLPWVGVVFCHSKLHLNVFHLDWRLLILNHSIYLRWSGDYLLLVDDHLSLKLYHMRLLYIIKLVKVPLL